MLALEREGVTGEWRKLYNEHRHDMYSFPDFIRVIKSRTIRLAGNVACRGGREMHTGLSLVNLSLEDLGVYGTIILK